ncbi:MAG: winged helix-turn-helix transcriptional regulator [Thaumarchaeota archaeon]|nr:winged helix-turn-helix transcriptional regulator [Nitrososphaerota archaeon]
MKTDAIYKIASSPIRLRLIELLRHRPRTLPELARELSITTQAAIKHVNILADNRIVEKTTLGGGEHQRPRHIYRLSAIIDSLKTEDNEVSSLQIFIKRRLVETADLRPRTTSRKIIEILQEIEEEASIWRRRLRLARQREKRLFLLLAALDEERSIFLKTVGFTPVDETLLSAHLDGMDQAGLKNLCKTLSVETAAVERFLHKLSEVWQG